MKNINKNKGYSLIEVLIYIAILAIIGTILTGYFITAITSEEEHSKRNAISTSIQNITSILKYDLSSANLLGEPQTNNSTSSILQIGTDDGVIKYSVNENGELIKEIGTTTSKLSDKNVIVKNTIFTKREHFESRLNATTTSIELNMDLHSRKSDKMYRSIDLIFLVGKDSI